VCVRESPMGSNFVSSRAPPAKLRVPRAVGSPMGTQTDRGRLEPLDPGPAERAAPHGPWRWKRNLPPDAPKDTAIAQALDERHRRRWRATWRSPSRPSLLIVHRSRGAQSHLWLSYSRSRHVDWRCARWLRQLVQRPWEEAPRHLRAWISTHPSCPSRLRCSQSSTRVVVPVRHRLLELARIQGRYSSIRAESQRIRQSRPVQRGTRVSSRDWEAPRQQSKGSGERTRCALAWLPRARSRCGMATRAWRRLWCDIPPPSWQRPGGGPPPWERATDAVARPWSAVGSSYRRARKSSAEATLDPMVDQRCWWCLRDRTRTRSARGAHYGNFQPTARATYRLQAKSKTVAEHWWPWHRPARRKQRRAMTASSSDAHNYLLSLHWASTDRKYITAKKGQCNTHQSSDLAMVKYYSADRGRAS